MSFLCVLDGKQRRKHEKQPEKVIFWPFRDICRKKTDQIMLSRNKAHFWAILGPQGGMPALFRFPALNLVYRGKGQILAKIGHHFRGSQSRFKRQMSFLCVLDGKQRRKHENQQKINMSGHFVVICRKKTDQIMLSRNSRPF
jgi:hypothetical protein